MHVSVHVKYPLFLQDFNQNWIFLTNFWKNTKISNFIKICSVGAKLFHVDRQTGTCGQTNRQTRMNKLIVTVHDSMNVHNDKPIKMHTQL